MVNCRKLVKFINCLVTFYPQASNSGKLSLFQFGKMSKIPIVSEYINMVICQMVNCHYGNMWVIGYEDVMIWRDGKMSKGKMSIW